MCGPAAPYIIATAVATAGSMVVSNQQQKKQEGIINQQKQEAEDAKKAIGPSPTLSQNPDLEGERLKRLRAMRYGVASTVKTSPIGLTNPPTVSSPVATGTKTMLGQ